MKPRANLQKNYDALLRLKARVSQAKDESLKRMEEDLLQNNKAIIAKDEYLKSKYEKRREN